jgi:hypothetical protein
MYYIGDIEERAMNDEIVVVPKATDRRVQQLLTKIGSPHQPVLVPVRAMGAALNDCFPIVQNKIKSEGGKMICGWQFWRGRLITEAEFHAVWESPGGQLIDLSPKAVPVPEILFVQDDKMKYEGHQVDNLRVGNTANPLLEDFIQISEARFAILNRGDRAYQHGKMELPEEERQLLHYLMTSGAQLYLFILNGCDPGSPCYCNQGKPYYLCHGDALRQVFTHVRSLT